MMEWETGIALFLTGAACGMAFFNVLAHECSMGRSSRCAYCRWANKKKDRRGNGDR